jgi:hypothetical protein
MSALKEGKTVMTDTLTRPEIMTPDNPHWEQFIDKLDVAVGLLGCGGDGTQLDPGTNKIAPQDPHWPTHALTRRVLRLMKCAEIDTSIDYFKEHGGYCDCEVLLNVDPW